MRSGLLGFGLGCLAIVGCSSEGGDGNGNANAVGGDEPELVSSAPAVFDVAALSASAANKKTFATPTGVTEICIIPARPPAGGLEDGFAKKDEKKEEKLCKVDFNAAPGIADVTAAGLSPKANSTNPATDVHEVTAELGRDVVESFAEANARDRRADKLGRLKSSLDADRYSRTSSYAPSIVGYYGTSRLLGNIGEVTAAVWRTLDATHHAKVAENGKKLTVPGSQIVKTLWASFQTADGASGPKGNLTYTSDGKQLYGAFIPSVSNDEKDKDIDTMDKLTGSSRFKRLVDARPLSANVGTDLKSAVEAIVPMQGVVEMLVLDALMLQGDRLSGDNVSYLPFMYFAKEDGSVDRMTKKDFDEAAAATPGAAPANAVAVKKLYLNDVDAGLIVRNADSFQGGGEYALLKRVAHVSPDLYARVRKLGALTNDAAFESFVKTEWRYTDRDFYRYKAMAAAVAALFHDRCAAGALVLDLDVKSHMANAPRPSCE